ncbi:gamma-glutamylcyclotransferase family protein [Parafrankia elaeagni]|uniref:gamma-glutamylcyclotransferase family protein n=1 Tax=Parafrankia elaeagni TaxID=222534 RepID=UPI00036F5B36|nr:gamma-glutamylcyclotransferase family protein [Parafrankia elaeagni]
MPALSPDGGEPAEPVLFAYGTLRFAEVVEALLGRRPAMTSGAVRGWRAAALRGRSYPGLVPAAADVHCPGTCLRGLTRAERELLDLFEGEPYEPRDLPLAGGGRAVAYLWRSPAEAEMWDWDIAVFEAEHLVGFIDHCLEWRRRVGVPRPPR